MPLQLSFPLKRLMVTGDDNTPNIHFPGDLADYITVHMTGNRSAGADAEAHAKWMKDAAEYSWHVTNDDIEAWQSIEFWMQGWHAGDGAGLGNRESIGLEICMHKGINQPAAYEKGAEIVGALRAQGHGKIGVVQHNYWTGKNCPELIRAEPGRWEWFLRRQEEHYQDKVKLMAGMTGQQAFDIHNRAQQRRMALRRLAESPDMWKVDKALSLLVPAGLIDRAEVLGPDEAVAQ